MKNLRDIFIVPEPEEILPSWTKHCEGLQDNGEDTFEISLWYAKEHPDRITEYKSIPKDWTWLDLEEILYNKTWSKEWINCSEDCVKTILLEFAERANGEYNNINQIWHRIF